MDTFVESGQLLGLSLRICCIGVIVQSAELIRHRRELREDGLLGWVGSDAPAPLLGRLIRRLHREPAALFILVQRALLAAVCLALPDGSALVAGALALLVLSQLYYHRRFAVIASDSEVMQLICLGACLAGNLPGSTPRLQAVALGFLALQVLIAYTASGVDKLSSPAWRSGLRLRLSLLHSPHRCVPLGEWLGRHGRVAEVTSWAVALVEITFPLCLLLPEAGFWGYLAAGLAFHALVAITMGLHGFWWAFGAAYPALYFLHSLLATHLRA